MVWRIIRSHDFLFLANLFFCVSMCLCVCLCVWACECVKSQSKITNFTLSYVLNTLEVLIVEKEYFTAGIASFLTNGQNWADSNLIEQLSASEKNKLNPPKLF